MSTETDAFAKAVEAARAHTDQMAADDKAERRSQARRAWETFCEGMRKRVTREPVSRIYEDALGALVLVDVLADWAYNEDWLVLQAPTGAKVAVMVKTLDRQHVDPIRVSPKMTADIVVAAQVRGQGPQDHENLRVLFEAFGHAAGE